MGTEVIREPARNPVTPQYSGYSWDRTRTRRTKRSAPEQGGQRDLAQEELHDGARGQATTPTSSDAEAPIDSPPGVPGVAPHQLLEIPRDTPYHASAAESLHNRTSTTGYLFFLGMGLISVGGKKKSLTAQSTVESELSALSYGQGRLNTSATS